MLDVEPGRKPLICDNPNCGRHGPFKAHTGPYVFFDGGKFVPLWLMNELQKSERYITHIKTQNIWVYNGGSYRPEGEQLIREKVRGLLDVLQRESYANETVHGIRETTYTEPEKFDAPVNLINLKNGILNTDTMELAPHTPDIVFIQQLPVTYDPTATCPNFEIFVNEIMHKDDVVLMQELFGYCLRRTYELAVAVMLLGEGENGKSTLLNVLRAMLGNENVATPSLQDLLNDRFAKSSLHGKLANIHADIPDSKLTDTGSFKMLTGQDLVYAQEKHRDPFTFQNYAKLWYSANQLPWTRDKTRAFWRRWIVIRFPNSFDNDTANPNLLQELRVELPGILNWAIAGLQRLRQNGYFTITKSRKEIEREWVRMTDSLRAFVETFVVKSKDEYIQKDVFYYAYTAFCDDNDIAAASKNTVGRRLPTIIPSVSARKPLVDDRQVHVWWGIKFSEDIQSRIEEKSISLINIPKKDEYRRNSQKSLDKWDNDDDGFDEGYPSPNR